MYCYTTTTQTAAEMLSYAEDLVPSWTGWAPDDGRIPSVLRDVRDALADPTDEVAGSLDVLVDMCLTCYHQANEAEQAFAALAAWAALGAVEAAWREVREVRGE